jgi:cytochrome P450
MAAGQATRDGQGNRTLAFFNAEYRRRQIAARAACKGFMSYGEAHRRLRKALAAAAAGGSMPELLQQVFGG